jgi:hypothetical protein
MKQKLIENGNANSMENTRTSLAEACELVMRYWQSSRNHFPITLDFATVVYYY